MNPQKRESQTPKKSGISESVHIETANNQYFNIILSNPPSALFCCELLELFEDLLNSFYPDYPRAFKVSELDAFIAPCNLQREYGEPK
jgi:hypothetical protein